MNKKTLTHLLLAVSLLSAIAAVFTLGYTPSVSVHIADAQGPQINPWVSYASSSAVLITSTSAIVSATNTARVYERISNLSGVTIYCNMQQGKPAIAYSGLAIFASSTYAIQSDENPYRGAITCIAPTGNASTTVLEQ